jgi:hypothetical protein
MHPLRLAYTTQFLIAVIAVFYVWSEVGGQGHLDLMQWYVKGALGVGLAWAIVKATTAAVKAPTVWNGGTLRWLGVIVALLAGCALATYYVHTYEEDDNADEDEPAVVSELRAPLRAPLSVRPC